jgi:hypothetical protein
MSRTHKLGLDANRPIILDGPQQGALAPTVADPQVIASTGAAWVRLNFVLGPWSSPQDQTLFQGRTWAQTYTTLVHQFREAGLNIYALVGHEVMNSSPDFLRVPQEDMTAYDIAQAQRWMDAYAESFLEVVKLFHDKVSFFESFNEPDDWHGQQRPWIHPTWFAAMLQAIHRKVKLEVGIQDVTLISGPLQGLEVNGNVAPTTYLRQTYQYGKQAFDWGRPGRPYPFDGVGYHLYIKQEFNPDWQAQEQEVRDTLRSYVDGMLSVIHQAEGLPSDKQLYVSEIGWPSNANTQAEKEFQARNLSLALELLDDDTAVALGVWFCTEDFDPGQKFYGLYEMGNLTPAGRKPSFAAYKALAERLGAPSPTPTPAPQPSPTPTPAPQPPPATPTPAPQPPPAGVPKGCAIGRSLVRPLAQFYRRMRGGG